MTALGGQAGQDARYRDAARAHAPAIARLARSVEADADRARDLEQDIHLALWRSFAAFQGQCAVSTWVYRVAHNVAATHAAQSARRPRLVALEDAGPLVADDDPEGEIDDARLLARLRGLIARLKPADRSIILLYLEGLDAAAIGEITGLTANHVAVKIHRIKALLASRYTRGEAA